MPPDQTAAKALVDRAYTAGQEALVQDEALAVLAAYHIPVLPSRLVTTPAEATTAARELGFPVVLKAVHPSMPVNRLAGSIALDLPDAAAVHRTVTEMRTRLASQDPALASAAILVQPQAMGGRCASGSATTRSWGRSSASASAPAILRMCPASPPNCRRSTWCWRAR